MSVVGAVIYLTPAADVGDELAQVVDGTTVQSWPVRAVRLWEQDAVAAVSSGALGLTVLSPLMRNATSALVEQAVEQVLATAPVPQQADLLAILGVFAEPLVPVEQFVRRVRKERLMATDLIAYLVDEQVAERETRHVTELQQTLEVALATRFPKAPLELVLRIRRITQAEQLHQLIRAAVQAPSLAAVEAAIAETSGDSAP